MEYLRSIYRTYTCKQLRPANVGEQVTLSGWILRKRDHGGVVFVDLRDNYGITQVVFSGSQGDEIQKIRTESVIRVSGEVRQRAAEMVNPKIETGEVEVHCQELELLSSADVLPFLIYEDDKAPEPTRLKYRFLELRREKLHRNILMRSKIIKSIRALMEERGFVDIQTPILTSSSPEGARDFLVPSRFHPGKFFALPQAPQQFKQLLMVAGFDRYYQIAPCFRDEDPRADRSPGEFYQLDLEMSFVEEEDVLRIGEEVFHSVFTNFSQAAVTDLPFPRIAYRDAFNWYGTDKPDLRVKQKLQDVSPVFQQTGFKVFSNLLEKGGQIVTVKYDVEQIPPRKYFDDLCAGFEKQNGFGLSYLVFEPDGFKGSIAKYVSEAEAAELRQVLGIEGLALVFMTAGLPKEILPAMGRVRVQIAKDLNQIEKNAFRFCIVNDFPMYEIDDKTGQLVFSHNPFSMPHGGMQALLEKDPLDIMAFQYDIIGNGNELASGAIRNHTPEIMYKAFEIAGYGQEVVDDKFGGMIRAFKYGAPPHGGMAPGIDRIVMLLAEEEAIRDVIAFPLAQTVEDLMMGAPSEPSAQQLKDLHIQVKLPEQKNPQ